MGKNNNTESSPSGFVSKPYLGRPRPSQLAPGVDGSLDPSLVCRLLQRYQASKGELCQADPMLGLEPARSQA